MTTRYKPTRFESGAILAFTRCYIAEGPDKFLVRSLTRPDVWYRVTAAEGCECYDHERTGEPCKHMIATLGGPAVFLALRLARARTLADMEALAREFAYSDEATRVAEPYKAMAREVYRQRRDALLADR